MADNPIGQVKATASCIQGANCIGPILDWSHIAHTVHCIAVTCWCSIDTSAIWQVTTPSGDNGKGQAHVVASDRNEGSQRDVLPYEQRRRTRLIYSDSDLHLQVGIRISNSCNDIWHCYRPKMLISVICLLPVHLQHEQVNQYMCWTNALDSDILFSQSR